MTEQRYAITYRPKAVKALVKVPFPDQGRIIRRIEGLATDPRPAGAKALVGIDGWRVRQGNYRIVYVIDDAVRVIDITRISKRSEVYRD